MVTGGTSLTTLTTAANNNTLQDPYNGSAAAGADGGATVSTMSPHSFAGHDAFAASALEFGPSSSASNNNNNNNNAGRRQQQQQVSLVGAPVPPSLNHGPTGVASAGTPTRTNVAAGAAGGGGASSTGNTGQGAAAASATAAAQQQPRDTRGFPPSSAASVASVTSAPQPQQAQQGQQGQQQQPLRTSPRSSAVHHTTRNAVQSSLSSFYQSQNSHLESAFTAMLENIQTQGIELDEHTTQLEQLGGVQSSIREEIDVVFDKWRDLNGLVGNLERSLGGVSTELRSTTVRGTELGTKIGNVESMAVTAIDALKLSMAQVKNELTALNAEFAPQGRVGVLSTRVDDLGTALTGTESALMSTLEDISRTTTNHIQKLRDDTNNQLAELNQRLVKTEEEKHNLAGIVDQNMIIAREVTTEAETRLTNKINDVLLKIDADKSQINNDVQHHLSTLRSEIDEDRTVTTQKFNETTRTTERMERISQDVEGLRLLDRERNRTMQQLLTMSDQIVALEGEIRSSRDEMMQDRDVQVSETKSREENMAAQLSQYRDDVRKISRDVDGLRLLDKSRCEDIQTLMAVRDEIAAARGDINDLKAKNDEARSVVDRFGQDVEMLRLADQERKGELDQVKSQQQQQQQQQQSAPPPAPVATSRGLGIDDGTAEQDHLRSEVANLRRELELVRVQEKTKQLRSTPPSAVASDRDIPIVQTFSVDAAAADDVDVRAITRSPTFPPDQNASRSLEPIESTIENSEAGGADVVKVISDEEKIPPPRQEDDPNDQINAALDGLRKLQESLNRGRGQQQQQQPPQQSQQSPAASASERLNARSAARSAGSAPSSSQSSPMAAMRKEVPEPMMQQPTAQEVEAVPRSFEASEGPAPSEQTSPEDTLRQAQEEVALLRQAREEINASLATLKMESAPNAAGQSSVGGGDVVGVKRMVDDAAATIQEAEDMIATPKKERYGAPGHTPAATARDTAADPIADAAMRRLRDDGSPIVGAAYSPAPDPTAPNVSRGGALPPRVTQESTIRTIEYEARTTTTAAADASDSGRNAMPPTPTRELVYHGTVSSRGVDPPDEISASSGSKVQRLNDPPDDFSAGASRAVPQVPTPASTIAQAVSHELPVSGAPTISSAQPRHEDEVSMASANGVETVGVTAKNKSVILIQKMTDERKKYQYYNPTTRSDQVVDKKSSSVETEVVESIEVVRASPTPPTDESPPLAARRKDVQEIVGDRGLDVSGLLSTQSQGGSSPPEPTEVASMREKAAAAVPKPIQESETPESSPDSSKWSAKSAGQMIEQRRIQRMLAGRASMEAPKVAPRPSTDAATLSPRSDASSVHSSPHDEDQKAQRLLRQHQIRKARPQGQRAAPPSRHRSIVEEAIQFARANRGPDAPSANMATSPKDFLSKSSKQRRKQQQPGGPMNKDEPSLGKEMDMSPPMTTQMTSPRMASEQSMIVTDDERNPASPDDSVLSDELVESARIETSARSPDDFENLRLAGNGANSVSPVNQPRLQQEQQQQETQPKSPQYAASSDPVVIQSDEPPPGCYLVYFSDSGGKLVLHYSKTPVDNAIGFWRAGNGKTIQGFKFRQNSGRVELIKGIAGGDANKRKFFSGWCQFIKAAAAFSGSVRKFPNIGGLEVELYAHSKDGTTHFLDIDNEEVDVSQFDAIACLPHHNNLFQGVHALDLNRFVNTANIAGAALPL